MNNFPTCRTCKYFFISASQHESFENCEKDHQHRRVLFKDFIEAAQEPFFCSEHTTKDGVKWVNWGEK